MTPLQIASPVQTHQILDALTQLLRQKVDRSNCHIVYSGIFHNIRVYNTPCIYNSNAKEIGEITIDTPPQHIILTTKHSHHNHHETHQYPLADPECFNKIVQHLQPQ